MNSNGITSKILIIINSVDKKKILGILNTYQNFIKRSSGYEEKPYSKFDNYRGKAGQSNRYDNNRGHNMDSHYNNSHNRFDKFSKNQNNRGGHPNQNNRGGHQNNRGGNQNMKATPIQKNYNNYDEQKQDSYNNNKNYNNNYEQKQDSYNNNKNYEQKQDSYNNDKNYNNNYEQKQDSYNKNYNNNYEQKQDSYNKNYNNPSNNQKDHQNQQSKKDSYSQNDTGYILKSNKGDDKVNIKSSKNTKLSKRSEPVQYELANNQNPSKFDFDNSVQMLSNMVPKELNQV